MLSNNGLLIKFLEGETFTAEQLAFSYSVSSKTIRKRIKDINNDLKNTGAKIISKPGCGFFLDVNDKSKFDDFILENRRSKKYTNCSNLIICILELLLLRCDYVKIDDMAEELYMSRGSINNAIKSVKQILEGYNLELDSKPNYGLKIIGKEFDIRKCIFENIDIDVNNEEYKIICSDLNRVLSTILSEKDIYFTIKSYQDLIKYLTIYFLRWEMGKYETYNDYYTDFFKRNRKEYTIAFEIIEKVKKISNIYIPETEVILLTMHLLGLKVYDYDGLDVNDQVLVNDIRKIIDKILHKITNLYNINLLDNKELKKALILHTLPLISRIKFNIFDSNPIKDYIKTNYPLSYELAVFFSFELKNELGLEFIINQDEISYFALHFKLVLLDLENKGGSRKVLVICPTGYTMANLLAIRLKENFSEYIESIETECLISFKDNNIKEYDLIVSTVPIEMDDYKNRGNLIYVSYNLNNYDLDLIRHAFIKIENLNRFNSYIHEDLFLIDICADTYTEVIKIMCDSIDSKYKKPSWLFESLIEREEVVSTDVGNLIALPHAMRHDFEESFIVIGILKNPILWRYNEVQVVIMMCLNTEITNNLVMIYDDLVKLVENEENIIKLLQNKSYEFFYSMLE